MGRGGVPSLGLLCLQHEPGAGDGRPADLPPVRPRCRTGQRRLDVRRRRGRLVRRAGEQREAVRDRRGLPPRGGHGGRMDADRRAPRGPPVARVGRALAARLPGRKRHSGRHDHGRRPPRGRPSERSLRRRDGPRRAAEPVHRRVHERLRLDDRDGHLRPPGGLRGRAHSGGGHLPSSRVPDGDHGDAGSRADRGGDLVGGGGRPPAPARLPPPGRRLPGDPEHPVDRLRRGRLPRHPARLRLGPDPRDGDALQRRDLGRCDRGGARLAGAPPRRRPP